MTIAPADMLCFALHSTAHAVHAAYAPLLEPLGLTYPQYLVLMVLSQRDGASVGAIGTELRLETNTLTPLLKRMERQGWLSRRRDTKDERMVRVTLTAAGRTLSTQAFCVPRDFWEKTGLTLEQMSDLRDILAVLRNRLKPLKS